MKNLLDVILDRLAANDMQWFEDQEIEVSDKAHHWMLNYSQIGTKNDHNKLTRGLVVEKASKQIVSFPFTRFFNLGEGHASPVDPANADIMEKMDGSMIGVFFPDLGTDPRLRSFCIHAGTGPEVKEEVRIIQPIWHTRKMISANPADMAHVHKKFTSEEEVQILAAAKKHLDKIRWDDEDRHYTFIFECISNETVVVTRYKPEQYGLYLIGARDMRNYQEFTEDELDSFAGFKGLNRPRRWKADSIEAVLAMAEDHSPDFEGYVMRCRTTGNRVKVKKKSYLERHRLLGRISYKRLVPLYIKGERAEIESYFPEVKELFDKIDEHYTKFLDATIKSIKEWQAKKLSRKDLALGIVDKLPKMTCAFIFKFIDVTEDLDRKVKERLDGLGEEKIVEVIGLD